MQDINRLIGEYYAARQSYDNAKKIADDFDRARRDAERRLVDHMLENGINKLTLDDGTTPTLVTNVSIKVLRITMRQSANGCARRKATTKTMW